MDKNEIYCGDCIEVMKDIEDNSIDAIVTDPPYGLTFMGKHWDKGVPGVEFWQEMIRVLKPGGYLLSFGGTRTYHRMATAIEDAGFEVRDMIEWVYGSGFPKSLNIGKAVDKLQGNERDIVGINKHPTASDRTGNKSPYQADDSHLSAEFKLTKGTSEWEGWGSSLKPSHEPICFSRKPLEKGLTIAENCLKYGCGGINIDESRVETDEVLGRTNNQSEARPIHQLNSLSKNRITIDNSNGKRFPANLIHDNSEEVRECFPESKGDNRKTFNNVKSTGMFAGGDSTPENRHNDSGNASRFFKSIIYQAKSSKSERNAGCEGLEEKEITGDVSLRQNGVHGQTGKPNKPLLSKNNHPTVKPIALMEYLIKMISREEQIILDPFMGSGTTSVACINSNRKYIGIELDRDSYIIAEARINHFKELAEHRLQQEVLNFK